MAITPDDAEPVLDQTTGELYLGDGTTVGGVLVAGSGGGGISQSAADARYLQKTNAATVATSGAYADLSGTPTIPAAQVSADWNASSGVASILNKPALFSGSYTDLSNKPALFSGSYADLTSKPSFAAVATSGAYSDITGAPSSLPPSGAASGDLAGTYPAPTLAASGVSAGTYGDSTHVAQFTVDAKGRITAASLVTIAGSGGGGTVAWGSVTGTLSDQTDLVAALNGKVSTSSLATVATSGAYSDLTGTPTLFSGAYADLTGKPTLFSGSYTDLTSKPTLGTAAATDSTAYATAAQGATADSAVQPGALATVATSGSYTDLSSKPSIPAAQVASDWNASSGVSAILNKPTLGTAAAQASTAFATSAQGTKADSAVQPGSLATVATSGAYTDLTGKPSLGTAAATDSTAYATAAQGTKADSAIQSIVAGANVTVDNTDPRNPVIASTASGGGGGTVTAVSVTTANGVSGTVASSTTTPAITLALGAITPSSVAASGAVTGSNLSGTNTGDQTSVTGNAGTATKLATARTIAGVSFDGTAAIAIPYANLTGLPALGALTIQTAKTSNYTFVLADANTCVPAGVALGSLSFTISPDSTTNFDVGTSLYIKQADVKTAFFAPGSGVTLNVSKTLSTFGKNEWVRAIKVAANTWDVFPFTPYRFDGVGSSIVASGVLTLDLSTSDYFVVALTASITSIVASTGASSPNTPYCRTISIRFQQPSSGSLLHVATGSTFHPVTGSDTDVVQVLSGYSVMVATTYDGGTRWEYVMKVCG
jgi:hypothetical protein